MKKLLLATLVALITQTVYSQIPVEDHFTASGGIVGNLNIDKFKVKDVDDVKYDFKLGGAGGFWVNTQFAPRYFLEVQATASVLNYKSDDHNFLWDSRITYFSVPTLVKFDVDSARKFAIMAGPQFDMTWFLKDRGENTNKDRLSPTTVSILIGGEFNPHGRFPVFLRYAHGVSNVEDRKNPDWRGKWYNRNIQIGIKWRAFGEHVEGDMDGDFILDKDDKCPTVRGVERYQGCPIPDTDGDGWNDEVDKCPTVIGSDKYQGCPPPDTDGDGLNDEVDGCPTVPGLPKYRGCPVPDTDGDGINDELDKCPTVPGIEKYQGCPIPDADGDGINDELDRCPTVPGVPARQGCPEIKYTAHAVTFAVNSAVLTASGKNELDQLYAYLVDHPEISIKLEGHTDASGNDKINNPLSENRALSAKAYLVSKGISSGRIETEGFGATRPVSDNDTKEGKAKNRRIEVSIL